MNKIILFVVVFCFLASGTAWSMDFEYKWTQRSGKIKSCWLCLKNGSDVQFAESGSPPSTIRVTNPPSSLKGAWAQCTLENDNMLTVFLPYGSFTVKNNFWKDAGGCNLGYLEPYKILGLFPVGDGSLYLSCYWFRK